MEALHVERLVQEVNHELKERSQWPKWRDGWPGRADLALLDAVYSTRQHYDTKVLPCVVKWKCKYPNPTIPELAYLAALDPSEISATFKNTKLPGVRILGVKGGRGKSEGVAEVASRLCRPDNNLGSAALIVDHVLRHGRDKVIGLLRETKGIGPATASYFLMLLGIDGVKVDTLLRDWVLNAVGDKSLSNEEIQSLITYVATEKFGCVVRHLDYAIWRTESTRRRWRRR